MTNEAIYMGTGRRKNAVARVRLVPGTGKGINIKTVFVFCSSFLYIFCMLQICFKALERSVFQKSSSNFTAGVYCIKRWILV